jgi:hypothetical protein
MRCYMFTLISRFLLLLAKILNPKLCRLYKVEDPVTNTLSYFADRISRALYLRKVVLCSSVEGV